MSAQPQPPSFHADLEEVYSAVTITLGDPPLLEFVRPPHGFTHPLTLEQLKDLSMGRFSAGLDAQLHACTLPPAEPLSEADRATIARLAGEA